MWHSLGDIMVGGSAIGEGFKDRGATKMTPPPMEDRRQEGAIKLALLEQEMSHISENVSQLALDVKEIKDSVAKLLFESNGKIESQHQLEREQALIRADHERLSKILAEHIMDAKSGHATIQGGDDYLNKILTQAKTALLIAVCAFGVLFMISHVVEMLSPKALENIDILSGSHH